MSEKGPQMSILLSRAKREYQEQVREVLRYRAWIFQHEPLRNGSKGYRYM